MNASSQSLNAPVTALQARFIFSVTSPPIENGFLVISGDRIVDVTRKPPACKNVINLNDRNRATSGGVAILPGLVNAHTHLEFSDIQQPLGTPGMAFPDWIRAVIAHRETSTKDDHAASQSMSPAIAQGLSEAFHSGTTTIGEIASRNWPTAAIKQLVASQHASPRCIIFREMLGLSQDHAVAAAAEFNNFQQLHTQGVQLGISPHAPYSTHWKLVEATCDIAKASGLPVAMHLAESPQELELLATGAGPFRQLLEDLGVWNQQAIPSGAHPLDYLKLLARATQSLVIHGNYLDNAALSFVATNSDRMAIVYCPRTHDFFQHARYPLANLIAAGACVCLGTDSRASTPDLNLLSEMRFVAAKHQDVRPSDVVHMATLAGAQALRLDHEIGSLEAGKIADLAVIGLPDKHSKDPHELLLHSDTPTVAICRSGII